EALSALGNETFDLILMDLQMPFMGGIEATTAIRQGEQSTRNHIPIIAMTAHAMKGDRENCLAAGMDGYVSKPLRPEELFVALEGLANGTEAEANGATAAPPPSASDALDRSAALRRAGGDEELLRELAGLCLDECPKLLAEIRGAVARRDGPQ